MDILNRENIFEKNHPNRMEKLFGHYKVTLIEKGLPKTKEIDGIKMGFNDLSPMIFASNHPITPVSLLLNKKQNNNIDDLYDDSILPQELLLFLRSIPEVTISPHVIPYYDQYVLTFG